MIRRLLRQLMHLIHPQYYVVEFDHGELLSTRWPTTVATTGTHVYGGCWKTGVFNNLDQAELYAAWWRSPDAAAPFDVRVVPAPHELVLRSIFLSKE